MNHYPVTVGSVVFLTLIHWIAVDPLDCFIQSLNTWSLVSLLLAHQGSKKASSICLGQVDFPACRVTFHCHLPDGQVPKQDVCQLDAVKVNLRLAQGEQNLIAGCL